MGLFSFSPNSVRDERSHASLLIAFKCYRALHVLAVFPARALLWVWLSCSRRMMHDCDCGFGGLAVMACFNSCSLSSVVGSLAVVMQYNLMSKYKMVS